MDHTESIYSLKREVREFRDAVQPLVPVSQGLPGGPAREHPEPKIAPYLRDVADHLHRTDLEVRTLDELLDSVLGAQQARVGTWQNDDMRRISAWAAIFAVPTMVAGVYGMNFEHMPELRWSYGYPLAVASWCSPRAPCTAPSGATAGCRDAPVGTSPPLPEEAGPFGGPDATGLTRRAGRGMSPVCPRATQTARTAPTYAPRGSVTPRWRRWARCRRHWRRWSGPAATSTGSTS